MQNEIVMSAKFRKNLAHLTFAFRQHDDGRHDRAAAEQYYACVWYSGWDRFASSFLGARFRSRRH